MLKKSLLLVLSIGSLAAYAQTSYVTKITNSSSNTITGSSGSQPVFCNGKNTNTAPQTVSLLPGKTVYLVTEVDDQCNFSYQFSDSAPTK